MRYAWTLGLAAAALVIAACGLEGVLQYDRVVIATGQWWRVVTGHLTHWSADHLAWDVAVLVGAGVVAETMSRRRMVVCVVGSILAISAAVWRALPEMERYRGLSGVDTALFVLVATQVVTGALDRKRWLGAIGGSVAILAVVGKTVVEVATGSAVFVDAGAAGFVPVPLAHLVGAGVGLLVGIGGAAKPQAWTRYVTWGWASRDQALAGR